jgi:hypothetical protein
MDGGKVEALKGEEGGGDGIKGEEVVEVSDTTDREEDTTDGEEEGNGESCKY